jgi:hypothetical protein
MSNEQNKKWHQSKSVWAGIVQTVLGLCLIFNVPIPVEIVDQIAGEGFHEAMAEAGKPIGYLNVIFGVLGTYFRIVAKRAITGGVEGVKDAVSQPIRWISNLFRKNKTPQP